MTDRIIISDLLLRGIIGIHDWEREKRQDILINIEMEADCRAAGLSDDFQDAVDYRAVTKQVIGLVENSEFFLDGPNHFGLKFQFQKILQAGYIRE